MRGKRWDLVLGCVLVAAVVGALVVFMVYRISVSGGARGTALRDLQAQGQSLVDAAERHEARMGRYPQTLEEAGASAPCTWYGRWRYESDGNSFHIEIGDYSSYEFLMYWNGDHWMIDN